MKKSFVAKSPDFGAASVRALRTRSDAKTLAAVKALQPPFDNDLRAELVAIAYGFPKTMAHPDGDAIRKAAKKLVDKHEPDAKVFAAAFKGIGVNTHLWDEKLRGLKHRLRLAIAKAIAFHSWNAITIPFEEDAEFRGVILDEAVARAKREGEHEVLLGELYTRWGNHGGSATSTNFEYLPPELAAELTARRKTYKFTGLSVWGGELTDLPRELAKCAPWLTSLTIAYQKMTKLPKVVLELNNLESLTVLGTKLKTLPDLRKLKKLRELDIGNETGMIAIPESVCDLDQVTHLRIGNGTIKHIPHAIAGMRSLEVLEMQSTNITQLPPTMASLPKLKKIEAKFSRLNPVKAKELLPGVTIET